MILERCKKLGLPSPIIGEIMLSTNGETRILPMHSWTRNALNMFTSFTSGVGFGKIPESFGTGSLRLKEVGGGERSEDKGWGVTAVTAGDGATDYGILVGTGSSAFSLDDHKLDTKIVHGVGSGQLSYGVCEVSATWDDTQFISEISRTFTNFSGNTITVNEIGLVSRQFYRYSSGTSYYYYFLAIRDVLAGVEVTDESSLTVTYKIKSPVYPSVE